MTAAQLRKLALAMDGVVERQHFQQPDFRVKNKIFAGLSRDGKQANFKLRPETQDLVVGAKPEAFIPAAGAWGRGGWTHAVLAKTTRAELGPLLEESYQLVSSPPRRR